MNFLTAAEIDGFEFEGLYFRQWSIADVPVMCRLFDTQQMDRWTPLASPFSPAVARDYVNAAREAMGRGTVQLAVCLTPEGEPAGELLMFPAQEEDSLEFAYAVGAAHQRKRVGTRSLMAGLQLGRATGAGRAILTIAEDNWASRATAAACGFSKTREPITERHRKGYTLRMQKWQRAL